MKVIPAAAVFAPVIPSLLIVIGITDAIHMIHLYFERLQVVGDERRATLETVEALSEPCVMTTLTTCIALVSLGFQPFVPIREFAW